MAAAGGFTITGLRVAGTDFGAAEGSLEGTPGSFTRAARPDGRELAADFAPSPPFPFRATASFEDLPLEPTGVGPPALGAARGHRHGQRRAGRDRPARGAARVTRATLAVTSAWYEVRGVRVQSAAPWRLLLSPDGALELDGLVLTSEGRQLAVGGRVAWAGRRRTAARRTTDLRLAQSLWPELTLSGPVRLDARLRGTRRRSPWTARRDHRRLRPQPRLPYPLREVSAHAGWAGR